MAGCRGASAQLSVLSNPDLVQMILEKMRGRVPVLSLDRKDCRFLTDRWAAGQVNRAFRQAALSLPWEARLAPEREAYLERFNSRLNVSVDTVALICGPRNLAEVQIGLKQDTLASCAALLCQARSVQVLTVDCDGEDTLLGWLQHTQAAGPCEGMSVQACLSSLSQLTRLTVGQEYGECSWSSASWLTALPGLRELTLHFYAGPPLGSLPCLQSLEVYRFGLVNARTPEQEAQHGLEDWAQPRLTTLTLHGCRLRIGGPASGSAEQGCAARLSQLQRLRLYECLLSVSSTGFDGQIPVLTHLDLDHCLREGATDLGVLVPRGLPSSLEGLGVENNPNSRRVLRSAFSVLKKLCRVEVGYWTAGAGVHDHEVAAALQSLTALPNLKEAAWVNDIDGNESYVYSWDRASGAFHRGHHFECFDY